jgi:hypothetical protein
MPDLATKADLRKAMVAQTIAVGVMLAAAVSIVVAFFWLSIPR